MKTLNPTEKLEEAAMEQMVMTQVENSTKTHIRVQNLSLWYDGNKALNNITLNIPDKKITAVIGPSGCGKTTLLKSLNRLVDLYDEVKVEGEVLIDGENIYSPKADILTLRKKVGFLPQRPYPLPMSIYDNVAFGPKIHGLKNHELILQLEKLEKICPRAEQLSIRTGRSKRNYEMDLLVEYYLCLAGLWDEVKDRLHAPAAKLSIGQQQRLALARVLAVDPEVILADEPTSALDPTSSKLVEKQFQMLKEHYTIVVVTHVLRQARRIADHAAFVYMGELVEEGPADRIFSSPQDERTKEYISGLIS